MTDYYNEIDPYAAQWLRNQIDAGLIPKGDVDERSIVDVRASDLRGYIQCHFFAGIGGWPLALRLAGWSDDRPVWSGSCPCQPFSAAGKGKAADDERHLWPAWFSLIRQCRPATIFGEQVEAAIGWGWLDLVCADLESQGYAVGSAVLPACGVGAPHIRNRLWFVGHANSGNATQEFSRSDELREQRSEIGRWSIEPPRIGAASGNGCGADPEGIRGRRNGSDTGSIGPPERVSFMAHPDGGNASPARLQRSGEYGLRAQDGGAGELADDTGAGWRTQSQRDARTDRRPAQEHGRLRDTGELGDTDQPGSQGRIERGNGADQRAARSSSLAGFWSDAEWIACTDGKARPVEPGSFPLGHGIPRRTSKLRAYGNAIVPQVAAEFIRACPVIGGL